MAVDSSLTPLDPYKVPTIVIKYFKILKNHIPMLFLWHTAFAAEKIFLNNINS